MSSFGQPRIAQQQLERKSSADASARCNFLFVIPIVSSHFQLTNSQKLRRPVNSLFKQSDYWKMSRHILAFMSTSLMTETLPWNRQWKNPIETGKMWQMKTTCFQLFLCLSEKKAFLVPFDGEVTCSRLSSRHIENKIGSASSWILNSHLLFLYQASSISSFFADTKRICRNFRFTERSYEAHTSRFMWKCREMYSNFSCQWLLWDQEWRKALTTHLSERFWQICAHNHFWIS